MHTSPPRARCMPYLGLGIPLIPGFVLGFRLMLEVFNSGFESRPPRELKFTAEFEAGPRITLPRAFGPCIFLPPGAVLCPRHRDIRKLGGVLGCEPHLLWAPIAFLAHSCTPYRNSPRPKRRFSLSTVIISWVWSLLSSPPSSSSAWCTEELDKSRRMTPAFLSWNPGS